MENYQEEIQVNHPDRGLAKGGRDDQTPADVWGDGGRGGTSPLSRVIRYWGG